MKNKAFLKKAAAAKLAIAQSAALHPLVIHLQSFLDVHCQPGQRLLLGLSGGLDSCVLLHLLSVLHAKSSCFVLHALHVHHGLSVNANTWADFCTSYGASLGIPVTVAHVQVAKDSGLGLEAAARKIRYATLLDFAVEGVTSDYVLTAHHQDDQAETLLLQLCRGAGVKGLAAMAQVDTARRLLRPLLDVSRQTLLDYAEQHALRWCEDESNEDTHYERNFLRHTILPLMAERSPAINKTLARTASHLAEAALLLDHLARIDAQPLRLNNSICLQGLAQLNLPRMKNALRWWFSQHQLTMPNADFLDEIVLQLLNAKPDANLCIHLHPFYIRRYQQRAYLCREQQTLSYDLVWNGEPSLTLPDGNVLVFKQTIGVGLSLKFGMTKLRVSNRDGGERFKPNALRPTRTLKHLLQEANIPPWKREHLPLIYWQDTLAFVPGIGIAHELQAAANEPGLEIVFHDVLQ